ncbi:MULTISPECIES: glycosyltransferase family 2 protein [unclassified Serratia (in: enterobacteria)]|uniref:glycosyltransferase family 2 protein n=1 Tax=unclassified Serratia (in: enterobacteria) TaxID=2647522 RepID=UPI000503EA5B|nr:MULTISPECIES: glycosyltransferase family A protein [unclassified Serratia (in: enterobacteria)]KFK97881.1 hypothetical protein JV45_00880 [Serratia sp. Ag2]KFL00272.1 hypothetical protein IV04_02190 [Serratia sp. Ag1]
MKISIIITTKNRQQYLNRAVESVLKNSMLPFDIVIVNDGGGIIEKDVLPEFYNYKIINNHVSLGGNKARNQGVLAASGSLIYFLDDDDAYTKDSISEKFDVFKKNKDVGLVYTGVQFVLSSDLTKVKRIKSASNKPVSFHDLLANGNSVGPTSCAAVRKSIFISAGMFDEKLHAMQDYELWIRMARCCNVMSDGGVNVIYTIHSSGFQVSSKYKKYIESANYIAEKFKSDLLQLRLKNKFWSMVYFRVALSASHVSTTDKMKYAIMSFLHRPNFKSLVVLLPTFILKKIKPFV